MREVKQSECADDEVLLNELRALGQEEDDNDNDGQQRTTTRSEIGRVGEVVVVGLGGLTTTATDELMDVWRGHRRKKGKKVWLRSG